MPEESQKLSRSAPSVFLSYAGADRAAVRLVAERLQEAGIRVWWDELLEPAQPLAKTIDEELKASDYVLLFISSSSIESPLLKKEVDATRAFQEFSDRSITLVPVLLQDVPLSGPLSTIQYLDFRVDPDQALEGFISALQESLEIDFASLSPHAFESLVEDLLVDLGFSAERDVAVKGRLFDFRGTFQRRDPFGALITEEWLFEVKHHSASRLSVNAIAEFVHLSRALSEPATQLAVITSGQITSAGRELIKAASVRIVEGVELRRILLTRPHLLKRHLGPHAK